MGEPGEKGEPGENGRVVDVFVNGTSVVNSEGFAYIDMGSEGPTYIAGDNITIENNVISAKDTLYFAGENVSIDSENVISAIDTKYSAGEGITIDSENVISAAYEAGENITISEGVISAVDTKYTAGENIVIDSENVISSPMLIDKVITVTENVGGYVIGDVISEDTPLRQIIETILAPAPRPEPPTENLFFWGTGGTRRERPTNIDNTYASMVIEPAVVQRDGIVKHFATNANCAAIAFPVEMPDLVGVYQNDLPVNSIDTWDKSVVEWNGKQYKYYANTPTKDSDAKYLFTWR